MDSVEEVAQFEDFPLDILRTIFKRVSIVVSGRLALTNKVWSKYTWSHLINTVRIWPTLDGVAKMRNADSIVKVLQARTATTCIQELRVFVDSGRGFDMCSISMSPAACSALLATCKGNLRHIAISFARSVSLKGLTEEALVLAPSIVSVELYITQTTRGWAQSFLKHCRIMEKLNLVHLSADMVPISATSIALSCRYLKELTITCASDAWTEFFVIPSITRMTLDITIPGSNNELNYCSYAEFWEQPLEALEPVMGRIAASLVRSCAGREDPLAVANRIKQVAPPAVGVNLQFRITMRNRDPRGASSSTHTIPLNALTAAVRCGRTHHSKSLAAIQAVLEMGANITELNRDGRPYSPAFCWAIVQGALSLQNQPAAMFALQSHLAEVVGLLVNAKWDPLAPAYFESFYSANSGEFAADITKKQNVVCNDMYNAFFVSVNILGTLEIAKSLLNGPAMHKVRTDGKLQSALIGPEKETILTAALRSPDAIAWLLNNWDVLADPSLPKETQQFHFKEFLNMRDSSHMTFLHHAISTPKSYGGRLAMWDDNHSNLRLPPALIKEVLNMGADPFAYDLSYSLIYPPAMYISRKSLPMLEDSKVLPRESETGYILTLIYCLLEAENLNLPFVAHLLSFASKFDYELLNSWRHPKLKIGFLHFFAVDSKRLFQGHSGFTRSSRQERLIQVLKRLIKCPPGGLNSRKVELKSPTNLFPCAEFLKVDCVGSIGTPYALAKMHEYNEIASVLKNLGADTNNEQFDRAALNETEPDECVITKTMISRVLGGRYSLEVAKERTSGTTDSIPSPPPLALDASPRTIKEYVEDVLTCTSM